ncbi:Na(+)/citrate cotransporter-like [Centruroides vittatus]|uniref:Na(+)/citrate cotransporter-like n=1 Tax=Centruroides vittatus TaxID=120091 RepID=UPI00350F7F01
MMIPIIDVAVNEIYSESMKTVHENNLSEPENKNSKLKSDEMSIKMEEEKYFLEVEKLRKYIYLSVAYAANIGSLATLTGAGPNLVLKFVLEKLYKSVTITYSNWLMYGVPLSLLLIVSTWSIFCACLCCLKKLKRKKIKISTITIDQKYQQLGSLKYNEILVMIMLFLMMILWIFRNPNYIKGWSTLFPYSKSSDTSVCVFVAILLFILPYKSENGFSSVKWKLVESKLQWGVLLLRGGGFAIAGAINDSGLSVVIGHHLASFHNLSKSAILLIFSIFASIFTEILSNTATATIIIPIVTQVAMNLGLNPAMMSIPVAILCSLAFMFPISSSSNAIICSHAEITIKNMVLIGFIIKCVSIFITLSSVYLYANFIFDLNSLPVSLTDGTKNFSLPTPDLSV